MAVDSSALNQLTNHNFKPSGYLSVRGQILCAKLLNEVRDEAVALLSDLIRINTRNPPGSETPAAKFLAERLEGDGLQCEVIESSEGRGNVVTRIKGGG